MCWGISGSLGQYLFTNEGMDSRWLVPIRLTAAGMILLLYCFAKYRKDTFAVFHERRDIVDLLIYGIPGISLCAFLYLFTIQLSNAATATILQNLSPVIVLTVECIRQKKKPNLTELISVMLALIGIYLIATHGTGTLTIASAAIVTGIACAVTVAVYNCYPKRILAKYPVVMLQGWAFVMGGILFALLFRIWQYAYVPSMTGLAGIAAVVVVGNVMAFPIYMSGVKLIGPQKSVLYGFSEPISAALISVVFMHTAFNLADALGFACVFFMMALISRKKE